MDQRNVALSPVQASRPLHPALAICGRNIRQHRHRQGISLTSLAKLAQTSVVTLDQIENGWIDPEFDLCLRIIIALHILPKDLFAGVRELSTGPDVFGFDAETVDDIEKARVIPSLATIIMLARALQVGPTELCEGVIVEAEER